MTDDPSLVDEWVGYSMSKRCAPTCAFEKRKDGQWVVYYVLESGKIGYSITFASPTTACALMMRMEMEEMRRSEVEEKRLKAARRSKKGD